MRVAPLVLLSALISLGAAEVDVIRIGYPGIGVGAVPRIPGTAFAPLLITHAFEDEFKADGIRIDWSLLKGAGPAVNELLAADQFDVVYLGDLAALVGRSNGIRTRLILAGTRDSDLYLVVPADSPAHSLLDLKGKRIALFKGTALQLQADRFVAGYGLTEADFKTINFDHGSGLAAVIHGDVDGLWAQAPVLEQVDKGNVRVVASTRDTVPNGTEGPKSWGVVLAREAFAAAHPALLQRIVNVMVRTIAWSSDESHRKELFDLWSESGYPASVFTRDFAGNRLADRLSPLLDDGFLADVRATAAAAQMLKLLRHPVDVDGWIDRSYLDRSLTDLHLQGAWNNAPTPSTPSSSSAHPAP